MKKYSVQGLPLARGKRKKATARNCGRKTTAGLKLIVSYTLSTCMSTDCHKLPTVANTANKVRWDVNVLCGHINNLANLHVLSGIFLGSTGLGLAHEACLTEEASASVPPWIAALTLSWWTVMWTHRRNKPCPSHVALSCGVLSQR